MTQQHNPHGLTYRILIGMAVGAVCGLLIKWLPWPDVQKFFLDDVFQLGGKLFMAIIKMLVVPIVFVSIVCGAASLGDPRKLGRIGGKAVMLYLLTTALAIAIALSIALLFGVGHGMSLPSNASLDLAQTQSIQQLLVNLVPTNIIQAMHDGEMLQIIVFALLLGIAAALAGQSAQSFNQFFDSANHVLMRCMLLLMEVAPYGVLCLIAVLFATSGLHVLGQLVGYFFLVLFVLAIQLFVTYPSMLFFIGRLNPLVFMKKMRSVCLFAFSVSSSNATIPLNLRNAEEKLGVKESVASFVIPLGATVNMDGSAMMQGVATVFIAHAYGVPLTVMDCLMVVLMATLASIGAAGVPSVGLVTLAMVLKQVGLPVEGIALIVGVDRLLDMARTAVNVAGDAMVSCLIANSESALNKDVYNAKD